MRGRKPVSLSITEKTAINDLNFAMIAELIVAPPDKGGGRRCLAFPELKMSKLRGIYGLIMNVYARVNNEDDLRECMSDLQYIKVKMAYESGRNRDVKNFIKRACLMVLLDQVRSYDQFVLYCRYAESLVAYFKFYGGEE